MLTARDLGPMLGVSPARVRQLIATGDLPSCRRGRALFVPRAAWEQWLAAQTARALTGSTAFRLASMPPEHNARVAAALSLLMRGVPATTNSIEEGDA